MANAPLQAVLRQVRKLAGAHTADSRSDAALLHAFATGKDQATFTELVKRHGPLVLAVCRRVLHHLQDAEDAFQATFLLLARQAASLSQHESAAGWLHEAAYRLASNARRARSRRRQHEGRAGTLRVASPEWEVMWREVQVVLDEEVQRLPGIYRDAFALCCLENRSAAEAARLLGVQEGTVWSRLARARARLQEALGRRGVSLSAVLAAAALAGGTASAALPGPLVPATVRAAALWAAGEVDPTRFLSANVANLLRKARTAMILTKLKTAALMALVLALAGAGVGAYQQAGAPAAEAGPVAAVAPEPRGGRPAAPLGEDPPAAAQPAKGSEAKTVEVRGRVLDPDGKPCARAKLYLGYASAKGLTYPVRATSGADGRFAFSFAQSDLDKLIADDSAYQVLAVAAGHGCAWATVDAKAAGDLTLRLVRDVPVIGRILDPEGRPVSGAKLTVTGVGDAKHDQDGGFAYNAAYRNYRFAIATGWVGPLPGQPAVLTTGADGLFKVAGVGRDRVVSLLLEGRGIATAALGANRASFEYQAALSRPIRGVVRDKDARKPLAGVTVFLNGGGMDPPSEVPPWPKAVTDKEGRYELLGLPKEKSYLLVVRPADGLTFQRRVELEDTPGLEALSADIELVPGAVAVSGKVTDKATGLPVAGARVEYHPLFPNDTASKMDANSYPRAGTTTGADGSYTLRVMSGPGVIGVAGPRPDVYVPALVKSKEIKEFFKAPAPVADGADGDGVLMVAAGGRVQRYLNPGDYNALALLEPGEKDKALVKDVALERAQERKGRVLGPDGQPLTGVRVIGLSSRPGDETLKGDEFTVRGLGPRQPARRLIFLHHDKKLGLVTTLAGEKAGTLTVQLQPCGSFSGRIVDQDGQPVAGFRGHILSLIGGAAVGGPEFTTDKEGRFRAEGLLPGVECSVYRVQNNAVVMLNFKCGRFAVVESGKNKDVGDIKVAN
jgi:RNA polymerase sigma factor (sigma-70 family)